MDAITASYGMETLYHADIFFFITAIAVIVVGIVLAVVGMYFILILRDLRAIVALGKRESELIAQDVKDLRDTVRKDGAQARQVFGFFSKLLKKNKKVKK